MLIFRIHTLLFMGNLTDAFYRLALTIWVGGTLAIGYLAAPILFSELPDRMLAGSLAGTMFTWNARVGLLCGLYVLFFLISRSGWVVLKSVSFWLAVAMLGCVIAGTWGIQPILQQLKEAAMPDGVMQSLLRDRFTAWHGVSSLLYVIQSMLGIALVFQGADAPRPRITASTPQVSSGQGPSGRRTRAGRRHDD